MGKESLVVMMVCMKAAVPQKTKWQMAANLLEKLKMHDARQSSSQGSRLPA